MHLFLCELDKNNPTIQTQIALTPIAPIPTQTSSAYLQVKWIGKENLYNQDWAAVDLKTLQAIDDECFFDDALLAGITTGLVNKNFPSIPEFRPRLILNDPPERKVLTYLKEELASCTSFDFSVAFINSSGLSCLFQAFTDAEKRGITGRIITTDYLHFTEPRALKTLEQFKNIQVKLFRSANDGPFHTKGYIFYKDSAKQTADVIIGSANITQQALQKTREWNIQIGAKDSGEFLDTLKTEFQRLWDVTDPYGPEVYDLYKKTYDAFHDPSYVKITEDSLIPTYNDIPDEDIDTNWYERDFIEPNSMQKEALTNLNDLRRQGKTKALVISATGTGKTYLCAFDVKAFRPKKFLFIVHRNKILKDAMASFKKIFAPDPSAQTDSDFGFFNAEQKQTNCKYVFAMVQTLSKPMNLQMFKPDEFDYIVIDEAHHIQEQDTTSYRRIIDYFKPKFLLGLTATPERTDSYNIYADFDNNIGYEIRLGKAMKENLLCPFHYFGVEEATVNGQVVDEKMLPTMLTLDARIQHLYEKVKHYSMNRDDICGLIFCSRVDEAKQIAEKLQTHYGLRVASLTGENSEAERDQIISRLEKPRQDPDALDYIISVDVLNEGVDIPCVNQVVMLRPTQSVIVYIQQLGRGLRLYKGKQFLTVIDFIGNYQNNFMIPVALYGDRSYRKETMEKFMISGNNMIDGVSTIDFEPVAKSRIFAAINSERYSYSKFLKEEYTNLKNRLGHIPHLMEFVQHGSISPLLIINNSKTKILNYPDFLTKFDKTYTWRPEGIYLKSLTFLSQFPARGLRPYELLILQNLISQGHCSIYQIRQQVKSKYNFVPENESILSAVRILSNGFFHASNRTKYGNISYCLMHDSEIFITDQFKNLLADPEYKKQVAEVLDLGTYEYESRHLPKRELCDLALYEKYTRQDVSALLNWEVDGGPTIMGYTVNRQTRTCPIFVTYRKSDNISDSTKYNDYFVSPYLFHWQTRSNVRLDSKEVIAIMGKDPDLGPLRIPLFVKKSNDEGSQFYYMGDVTPLDPPIQNVIDGKPVVDIQFAMHHEVPQPFFEYFEESKSLALTQPEVS